MSIFVGNLPFRAEREDIIHLFTPFGEVLNCSLPLERDTGRKRGFAFIEMADEAVESTACLLYTSPSPRDKRQSRMPSSA